MKKRMIAVVGVAMVVGMVSVQASEMDVAALDFGGGLSSERIAALSAPTIEMESPIALARKLSDEGDRLLGLGQTLAAIRLYIRSGEVAEHSGLRDESAFANWKLGTAFLQLAGEQRKPGYVSIAQAFYSKGQGKWCTERICVRPASP